MTLPDAEQTLAALADRMRGAVAFDAKFVGIYSGGAWIAERLNRCGGEVRFLIPENGVSAIDAPGQPFYDPEADAALFDALVAATLARFPGLRR